MEKKLKELAELVDGSLSGNGDTVIQGIAGITHAEQGQITFLSNGKYRNELEHTGASAIVLSKQHNMDPGIPAIRVDNPDLAFARIAAVFERDNENVSPGIHETAVVSDQAEIGEDVAIQSHVTVEDGASIGDQTILMAGSYVGEDVNIGEKCRVHPNVTVMRDTHIGDEVIIHSSSVIGCDGFGYAQEENRRMKIPQRGRVVLEDQVEIGSCVTIDRARFDETRIGKGVKIDNLVQIAHNVQIGEHAVIVAQSGLAGSSQLGENSMLGGQSGVAGHLTIGKNVKVAARAGVTKDVEDGQVVSGFPAQPRSEFNRKQVLTRKLPALAEELEELKEQVEHLEKALENHDSTAEDDQRDS